MESVEHTQETLTKLKLPELKALCKEKKLPVSGTKAELVQRILGLETSSAKNNKDVKSVKKQKVSVNEMLQKPVFNHLAKQAQHFVIKRNIHGNYEHLETHLVFSLDKKVIGVQEETGEIRDLNVLDLENVNRYHFELDKNIRVKEITPSEDFSNTEERDNQRFQELVSIIE